MSIIQQVTYHMEQPADYRKNNISEAATGTVLADLPQHDLYWEALIEISRGNRQKAEEIVRAIKSGEAVKIESSGEIDSFFDRLFISEIMEDPETLSYMGLLESIGLKEHNKFLNNISREATLRDFERARSNLKLLQTYSPENITPKQRISYKIFLWSLNHKVAGEKFLFHGFAVNQMFGVLQNQTALFTQFHRLESEEDFDNYIIRLSCIPAQLKEAVDVMRYQRDKAILPPRFTVEKVIGILDNLRAPDPLKNIFYLHFAEQAEKSGIRNIKDRLERVEKVIRNDIYPAYGNMRDFLNDLLPAANENRGAWSLPDGDEYYSYVLRGHTTTDLTPDEIHTIGLEQVALIQREIRDLLAEEGVRDDSEDIGVLLRRWSENPAFYYPDSGKGREECLCDFEKILDRSRKELAPLFNIKPSYRVKLEPVPKHEEAGAPAAYYYPPSIDGARPGIFFVNLRSMAENPKYRMETLAIHEAEPGHHFQCALQNEMSIPILRKLGSYTSYVEGWALYTEKLGLEHDFYSSTASRLGHFQDELLRAVRLVVDTGIHSKRWSREQAIEYMEKECGMDHSSVVTEVERYFVMPGQACAYKIGQLKMMELRKKALAKLGRRFDIRQFHDIVLSLAAAPLEVLEEVVDDYIEKRLSP